MSTQTVENPNTDVMVVSKEMALLSNILAAYTFITDQPERTALVFLGGVSVGLLVTLCAVVFQIHCRADCHYGNSKHPRHRHHHHHRHRRHHHVCQHHQQHVNANPDNMAVVTAEVARPNGDSESEDWDEAMDMSSRRRRRFERALLHASMFTSAEELDQAQRLEERERILREIWMNGQPDISTVTQSLNRYY
ncbi:protein eva-1 homolog A [Phyllopteryx taeniolatus]|uniref:protein eva-1 homolog A n=1 Tax=Phyllopteryx taeniolatus TaxID=161469 RepID=UPI002AD54688|nr:protein eva-1 homolog A [Phyllopteryx taeniolatus]XP_061621880.1 protein eva-1 homolog A [Phyllopteryx taeniolatus]XP_061621882.1 protein eva-1 homolog A [Phyllopteryx taeniolatus]XP_061621883.1 protein eva-1 homolog A [Phyllopteryx taeniolatus]XP_061621884.1 protein eva-1 homolog A [Phyllopteryx taeniolatus]XP_061621885.1 protein eva-1 homolog A [Phyllopteryx taeniolatus]XP_061621886.1 protein eva-1 homolog A [Phyllopteryx taeniolatus]XP_061621887.1 protein eva-1 homolog A [Phyllopteryx 